MIDDAVSRCKWSTNVGEPLLFVKYDFSKLNVLDVEKHSLTLKHPICLEGKTGSFNLE